MLPLIVEESSDPHYRQALFSQDGSISASHESSPIHSPDFIPFLAKKYTGPNLPTIYEDSICKDTENPQKRGKQTPSIRCFHQLEVDHTCQNILEEDDQHPAKWSILTEYISYKLHPDSMYTGIRTSDSVTECAIGG